jgi:predicted TIM-barrel fold metal-dependent hydrolase
MPEPDMPDSNDTPRFPMPKGACDCHFHILGPKDIYPPKAGTVFLMPDALPSNHAAMRARTGLERMVLVQHGGYYGHNQPMLDVLAAEGDIARGVATFDPEIADEEIAQLNDAGVRGMRIHSARDMSKLEEVWGQISSLAKRFVSHGWHIQLLLSGHMRDALLPRLADLPVPVVIDHLGLFRPDRIEGHEGFAAFLKLLECEHIWVKVSGADRVTRNGAFEDALPVMRELINTAPDRMVWGTDWPHTSERPPHKKGDPPIVVPYGDVDENRCLAVLADACPDAETFNNILTHNPARLYGF